jgi:acyl-CoA synthetase (AMP-forming)/AMP-acid ligase II
MSTILGKTLCESLLAAADRHGTDWCLRVVRSDGSFQDMDRLRFLDMALRAAAWMRSVGVAPGDRVILCLENSPAWGAAYFAVLLAGGVAVPVDIASVPSDAFYYLEKTRARLVLSSRRDLFTGDLPAGCLLAHTLDAAPGARPAYARCRPSRRAG